MICGCCCYIAQKTKDHLILQAKIKKSYAKALKAEGLTSDRLRRKEDVTAARSFGAGGEKGKSKEKGKGKGKAIQQDTDDVDVNMDQTQEEVLEEEGSVSDESEQPSHHDDSELEDDPSDDLKEDEDDNPIFNSIDPRRNLKGLNDPSTRALSRAGPPPPSGSGSDEDEGGEEEEFNYISGSTRSGGRVRPPPSKAKAQAQAATAAPTQAQAKFSRADTTARGAASVRGRGPNAGGNGGRDNGWAAKGGEGAPTPPARVFPQKGKGKAGSSTYPGAREQIKGDRTKPTHPKSSTFHSKSPSSPNPTSSTTDSTLPSLRDLRRTYFHPYAGGSSNVDGPVHPGRTKKAMKVASKPPAPSTTRKPDVAAGGSREGGSGARADKRPAERRSFPGPDRRNNFTAQTQTHRAGDTAGRGGRGGYEYKPPLTAGGRGRPGSRSGSGAPSLGGRIGFMLEEIQRRGRE